MAGLSLLTKDSYKESFDAIASIAAKEGRGGPRVLLKKKDLNEKLLKRIKSLVGVTTGRYFDDLTAKKVSPGQRLCYEDRCVEITVEVTATGMVLLRKGAANVTNANVARDEGWGELVNLVAKGPWPPQDMEFQDPLEIIRQAKDKKKLHKQDTFKFKQVP